MRLHDTNSCVSIMVIRIYT